jgi:hypothetical protein
MAKQKKKRNKRYKKKYTTDNRLDMSKGGRVSYQVGGNLGKKPEPQDGDDFMSIGGPGGGAIQGAADEPVDIGDIGSDTGGAVIPPVIPPITPPVTPPTETPVTGTPEQIEQEKRERGIRAGRTAEQIAAGQIPEGTIPTSEAKEVSMEGTEAKTVELEKPTPVEATKVEQTPEEQVALVDGKIAETPEQVEAATMDPTLVGEKIDVEAAKGEIADEAIAKAAGVERVAPIEGAAIDIPEGALTERVVGTLSESAKAVAAQNAGTSLSRITRAKKQLSKAGLSDADIEEIGNDPEALEDRLADFSEEERGIIEGLPQEALVSTQMNKLLEGIEEGEIPVWARPAVASVEQMLAQRGMSASTVGRDALLNAIIQSAMPIAQSNAQAIQSSVAQQKDIEAREAEANTQRRQQTALTNAQNVFNMDMAQFNADQQVALSNSRFLQTVGLTEASNEQQATIQNALLMSQANLAEADFNQQAQIQNAKAFLAMDMANLNNEQQANIVKAQQEQQRMLSNQAASNAAKQFNSASENQTNQFMASLAANIAQFNVAQMNNVASFNAQSKNAAAARNANRIADVNKINATIMNDITKFNAGLDFSRNQWNAANEQAVINSNVNWRRQANLANTAAQNAVNQQNVQNAFGLTSSALSFIWNELADQATKDFTASENAATRKLQAMVAAASSEGDAAKHWSTNFKNASSTIDGIFGKG